MKKMMRQLFLGVGQLHSQKARLIIVLIVLSLFVIGAGAPEAPGGPGWMAIFR